MDYPDKIHELLKKANIEIGDTVQVSSDNRVYKGILMPHHEFSGDDIITLKLDTGYNIGVSLEDKTELRLLEKAVKSEKNRGGIDCETGNPFFIPLPPP